MHTAAVIQAAFIKPCTVRDGETGDQASRKKEKKSLARTQLHLMLGVSREAGGPPANRTLIVRQIGRVYGWRLWFSPVMREQVFSSWGNDGSGCSPWPHHVCVVLAALLPSYSSYPPFGNSSAFKLLSSSWKRPVFTSYAHRIGTVLRSIHGCC